MMKTTPTEKPNATDWRAAGSAGAPALTREEMTEALYLRAEEIFLLCAIITRRGLAHAFCSLDAHVGRLDSRVLAVDQVYQGGTPHVRIAELNTSLEMCDWMTGDRLAEEFKEIMEETDTYVTYLDFLIAKNTPVLTNEQETAT